MKKIFITFSFLILIFRVYTQDAQGTSNVATRRLATKTDVLIKGYRNINIGMSKGEVIDTIKKDPLMMLEKKYYRDIDLSTEETKNIVEIVENKYFKNGYFLFKDDKLYSIIIMLQSNQADFLEMLETLNEKYSKGSFINASTVSWENSNIKLTLERPATVKYTLMDNNTNNTEVISEEGSMRKSLFEGL